MEQMTPSLCLRIVYTDDDLIEIESRLVVRDWAAKSNAYASARSAEDLAIALAAWVLHMDSPFTLELGADTGIGWCCLRFCRIDKAGHLACQVKFATMSSTDARPEETSRLSAEMRTEVSLVESFAKQLAAMAHGRSGDAVLQGVID